MLIINGVNIYAQYKLKGHNGIDFGIPAGTKLYSCIDGEVIESRTDIGYGNYVKIENNKCGVLYAHLESLGIAVGESVKAGQLIGLSGNTGNSTGPHLHFGVFPKPRNRANGYNGFIDPLDPNLIDWVEDYYGDSAEEKLIILENDNNNLKMMLQQSRDELNDVRKSILIKDARIKEIIDQLEQVIK